MALGSRKRTKRQILVQCKSDHVQGQGCPNRAGPLERPRPLTAEGQAVTQEVSREGLDGDPLLPTLWEDTRREPSRPSPRLSRGCARGGLSPEATLPSFTL